jgi:ribonuclease VapC
VQACIALDARVRYGCGMGHGGVLNFCDAFACALAKIRAAPLPCTGQEFGTTTIAPTVRTGRR